MCPDWGWTCNFVVSGRFFNLMIYPARAIPLVFNLLSFFFSVSGFHSESPITFRCHVFLGSCWLWQFFSLSFFLMTLTVLWSTGQVLWRRSLSWNVVFFSHLDRDYWFGEEDVRTKVSFSRYYIKGTYCSYDLSLLRLTLIIWLRFCFSAQKLLFSPLPCHTLCKEVTVHGPHLKKLVL